MPKVRSSSASVSVSSSDEDTTTVSPRFCLSETLVANREQLFKIPLTPVNCSFGVVTEKLDEIGTFSEIVRLEAGLVRAEVTVVFAIRRPGCSSCREHGLQLTQVVAQEKGVALWGIVKETGVDDMGLLDFYEKFFRFPLYKDQKWLVYKAMGNRKITMKSLMAGLLKSRGRYKKKNIETTTLGEGWLQGGLLIFDKHGTLRFGSEEHFGYEINAEELRAAIQKCRLVDRE